MTKKAAFSFENFNIEKVNLDLSNRKNTEVDVSFEPSGEFRQSNVKLKVVFKATTANSKKPFIEVEFIALFKFEGAISFDEIPEYFYKNSIAIVFPYIRAFISNITLQGNIYPPVILPTWNLSSLAIPFKEHMIDKDIDDVSI